MGIESVIAGYALLALVFLWDMRKTAFSKQRISRELRRQHLAPHEDP